MLALPKEDTHAKYHLIMPPSYTIPTIDLADQTHRQIVVDKEEGQYLGHVSTVLLED
jgi:hypothetical protein